MRTDWVSNALGTGAETFTAWVMTRAFALSWPAQLPPLQDSPPGAATCEGPLCLSRGGSIRGVLFR